MEVDATSLAAKRAEVAANPGDMRARLDFARMLRSAEQFEEATEAHLWFWEHVLEHDQEFRGVRRSFFVADLEKLISRHEPARSAIANVRDRVAAPEDREPDPEAFADWSCLNRALGRDVDTLRWFDEVYKNLPSTDTLDRIVERFVLPLLSGDGRLGEWGARVRDPLAVLARAAELHTRAGQAASERGLSKHAGFREVAAKQFRVTVASLVRALHGAGRTADVQAVSDEARRLDRSDDMSTALANALS